MPGGEDMQKKGLNSLPARVNDGSPVAVTKSKIRICEEIGQICCVYVGKWIYLSDLIKVDIAYKDNRIKSKLEEGQSLPEASISPLQKPILEPPYIESHHRICTYNETSMVMVKLPSMFCSVQAVKTAEITSHYRNQWEAFSCFQMVFIHEEENKHS
ncbi:hypothetical protein DV515_00001872 [Chloebia gouldiae]|uniref:Uncharacterized protein n=1 Tax=Chloebia gouldiae TaxID=44316 RepID=A0A3L8SZV8_CHLGU|nr:hypothetical protein DV515_00001872 [Chloebia gouldiae]